MRLAAGLHPALLGELKCSPDSIATRERAGMGKGTRERGEERGRGRA